jgi:ubiquinone/menaquinone biosynthesis C-methylase UbiE/uncharacterized protein YbaR (Trm112 family)
MARRAFLDTLVCPLSGAPLRLDVVDERDGDIRFGVLASEVATYPVVAGVPVLLPGHSGSVELLRRGALADALVASAFADVPPSGVQKVTSLLRELRPLRSIGDRAEAARSAVVRRRRRSLTTEGPGGPGLSMRDALVAAYVRSPGRSPDAYDYFAFRFGIPRYIVGLAYIEGMDPTGGEVLDAGCGAGHLTWALRLRLAHRRLVAMDRSLLLLLAARRLVPDADLVCGDITASPFRPERFSTVFSSDVLSFVAAKTLAVRELRRVLAPDGELVVTSVINKLTEHTFAGSPLSPEGWSRLFEPVDHEMVPDRAVIEHYFARRELPAGVEPASEALRRTPTLSIHAGRRSVAEPARTWPHSRGVIDVNPLLRAVRRDGDGLHYRLEPPSSTFADDNEAMRMYLPSEVVVPRDAVERARAGGRSAVIDELLERCVLLGFPDGYLDDVGRRDVSVP